MSLKKMNEGINKLDKFEEYLLDAEASFEGDPADSDYQRGYQAAVVDILDHWQRLGLGVFNHDA